MNKENFRSTVLDKYGASEKEKEELLVYNRNVFDHSNITSPLKLPLEDELFASAWEDVYHHPMGACGFLRNL